MRTLKVPESSVLNDHVWYIFPRLEVSSILGADFRVVFIPLLMYSYTQEARKAGTGPPFIIDAANKGAIEFMVPSVMVSIPSDGSQPSSSVPTKNVILFDFSASTNKRDDLKN